MCKYCQVSSDYLDGWEHHHNKASTILWDVYSESYSNVTPTIRLDIDSDDGWEAVDDDTRDLIGGGQLQ